VEASAIILDIAALRQLTVEKLLSAVPNSQMLTWPLEVKLSSKNIFCFGGQK
jgi:hypothetical protein